MLCQHVVRGVSRSNLGDSCPPNRECATHRSQCPTTEVIRPRAGCHSLAVSEQMEDRTAVIVGLSIRHPDQGPWPPLHFWRVLRDERRLTTYTTPMARMRHAGLLSMNSARCSGNRPRNGIALRLFPGQFFPSASRFACVVDILIAASTRSLRDTKPLARPCWLNGSNAAIVLATQALA